MGKNLVILGLILVLAACSGGRRRDMVAFDGQFFKARASSSRQDRAAFAVTVTPVSASLSGAREAGRYEAVKYCIRTFGSSEMDWELGPDAPEEALVVVEDTLTFSGRCVAR